jgi:hypothetical protein
MRPPGCCGGPTGFHQQRKLYHREATLGYNRVGAGIASASPHTPRLEATPGASRSTNGDLRHQPRIANKSRRGLGLSRNWPLTFWLLM